MTETVNKIEWDYPTLDQDQTLIDSLTKEEYIYLQRRQTFAKAFVEGAYLVIYEVRPSRSVLAYTVTDTEGRNKKHDAEAIRLVSEFLQQEARMFDAPVFGYADYPL